MRVLIAGGGTGGHVIPALAIAGELRKLYGAEIRFVGTARGMETRLVPQAGYRLELIAAGQLNRVSWRTKLTTLAALPRGLMQCIALLRRWRPNAVVGVGGYASGPAMLAAILTRTPTLAFEPNAIPGMANRWIGRRASAAAVNFPSALACFRNGVVTGIPVRNEFFQLAPKPAESSLRLLVIGGSQGARALNLAMSRAAKSLLEAVPGLTILHQAGSSHAAATAEAYAAAGAPWERWEVRAFIDDMPRQFALSDLILARSGAGTVAELAAARKPSLLVPFPRAADDHQRRNAEAMAQNGAAAILLEQEMSPEGLAELLRGLLVDREALRRMGEQAGTMAQPDAAGRIAAMVKTLAGTAR